MGAGHCGFVGLDAADHEMDFEVVGEITDTETFATGSSIRELPRLRKAYGAGRWRKRKGIAEVRLAEDRKSTRLNSSHLVISYAVFCLKKKKKSKTDIAVVCK